MKQNLISIVQSILSDMDSENVNSISDSVEAEQVASIVRDTFNNIIATREISEHRQLIKLTANSDSLFPTHFEYGENVKEISKVWYKNESDIYYEVKWCEPLQFLTMTDSATGSATQLVQDKSAGTQLSIRNDHNPSFYTSFDDNWIVMDSFNLAFDDTLQESKVRAYGVVYPTFSLVDTHIPDLDATLFPYLLAEAKSTAMSLLKGQSDPKIEQAARRQKNYIQNDMFRTRKSNSLVAYGRR
jgi:hypothetical protein